MVMFTSQNGSYIRVERHQLSLDVKWFYELKYTVFLGIEFFSSTIQRESRKALVHSDRLRDVPLLHCCILISRRFNGELLVICST